MILRSCASVDRVEPLFAAERERGAVKQHFFYGCLLGRDVCALGCICFLFFKMSSKHNLKCKKKLTKNVARISWRSMCSQTSSHEKTPSSVLCIKGKKIGTRKSSSREICFIFFIEDAKNIDLSQNLACTHKILRCTRNFFILIILSINVFFQNRNIYALDQKWIFRIF
jgi:hypothetical protein